MYIKLKNEAKDADVQKIIDMLKEHGLGAVYVKDTESKKIGILGNPKNIPVEKLEKQESVEQCLVISKPYKLASREFKNEDTVIDIKGIKIGGNEFTVMAGPCSIENREMIFRIAEEVKAKGGQFLRGGAFKPRTSPYDFQGLGEEGLKHMKEAADAHGLLVITEVMDSRDIELVGRYADIFQVGARNMQNFSLLKELGKAGKPVLIKRGMAATVRDLLMAAEYVMAHGNSEVILCERGIRTFETMTRNTFDINAVALLREKTHLPVIADSSHGTGRRSLVTPIACAAIMAGAQGVIVEVHENPSCAFSDGEQSLNFHDYGLFSKKIKIAIEAKKMMESIK